MRTLVGATSEVLLSRKDSIGRHALIPSAARMDTGAAKSSIDRGFARAVLLHRPVVGVTRVVQADVGTHKRKLVRLIVRMPDGRRHIALFTLANRSHCKYPVLIGRNILRRGYVVDVGRGSSIRITCQNGRP